MVRKREPPLGSVVERPKPWKFLSRWCFLGTLSRVVRDTAFASPCQIPPVTLLTGSPLPLTARALHDAGGADGGRGSDGGRGGAGSAACCKCSAAWDQSSAAQAS